jgi:hypothetical protein
MKSRIWMLAVLALAFCQPQMAAAQGLYPGAQSQGMFNTSPFIGRGEVQGMFGTQTVGMPLRNPVPGMFGTQTMGLSMAPYANRLGGRTLVNAMSDYSNPGGVYGPTALGQQLLLNAPPMFLLQSEPAAAPATQPPGPVYNLTEVQAAPQTVPQTNSTNPEANGTEGANQTADGQTATAAATAAAAPAFPYVLQSRAGRPTAYASFARPQSYNRSPELSDRLTRIARQKNMLAGQGIDVYLGDRVAVLKGVVRTAGDRSLLANVVGLEPEVQYVDNRLTTEAGSSLSANHASP